MRVNVRSYKMLNQLIYEISCSKKNVMLAQLDFMGQFIEIFKNCLKLYN